MRKWISNRGNRGFGANTDSLILVKHNSRGYDVGYTISFNWDNIVMYSILENGWEVHYSGHIKIIDEDVIDYVICSDGREYCLKDCKHEIDWSEVLAYKLKGESKMTIEEQRDKKHTEVYTYNTHYNKGGLDVAGKFDVVMDKLGELVSTKESAYLFNVFKYFERAGEKEGESLDKDLTKCANYMCRFVTGKFLNELEEENK